MLLRLKNATRTAIAAADDLRHRRTYARRTISDDCWDFDESAMLARMRAAIKEENGHVYLCLPDFLPEGLYRTCVSHWPLMGQFESKGKGRNRIVLSWLPEAPLPEDVRRFWHRFGHDIINGKIKPLLAKAFLPYLNRKFPFLPNDDLEWVRENFALSASLNEGLNLDQTFEIGPHVDQHFIFVTSLLYMPRNSSQENMGTMLFKPNVPGITALTTNFPDKLLFDRCHQFPFLPNVLASFLQTPTAFHGYVGRGHSMRRSYQFNTTMDDAVLARAYRGQHVS